MNRRILLIAVAVVLALVGTFAVYRYVNGADQRAIAKTQAAQVVFAQKAVPAGTSWSDAVKDGYLAEENLPADAVPSTAIGSLNASVPIDDVATADIAAGNIVIRTMFGAKSAVTGALPIPKGDLAVSVSISGAAAVSGFVQPQSEVAIFATFDLPSAPTTPKSGSTTKSGAATSNDKAPQATKLLFARVEVLATSQPAPGTLNKANSSGGMITLALSQAQAEQLILASSTSTLYLGLLSDNSVTTPDGGVTYTGSLSPIQLAK